MNRSNFTRIAATLALIAGSLVPSAMAGTLYYQGNPLTLQGTLESNVPNSAAITATVTLASDLGPNLALFAAIPTVIGFSISDGTNTLTEANSFFNAIFFGTDSNGNITEWFMSVYGSPNWLATFNPTRVYSTGTENVTVNDSSFNGPIKYNLNPGTWSTSSPVPEPGTLTLLAGASLAAVLVRRRRNF